MGSYIIRRSLYSLLTLFGVSLVAFALLHSLSGDPSALLLGPYASEEAVQKMRKELRIDEPIWSRYGGFIENLARGDLKSLYYNQPAFSVLFERFPATIELTVAALIIAGFVSVTCGILSAIKRDTFVDYSASAMSLFGISMPDFWLGTMLILLFAVHLQWFPAFGRGPASFGQAVVALMTRGELIDILTFLHHLFLPALTLSAHVIGVVTRVTRSSMLDQVNKEYVTVLRSKGLPERAVVIKHMFRNALLPVITISSMQFVKLLGGAVIVETVFGWPGIGFLMVDAIYARDYPLVQAGIMFFSIFFIAVNLLVDLLYTYLDPRISY